MDIMQTLEIIGSATGVLGAITMAVKAATHSHWAWSLWLISSTSLVIMAFQANMLSLMLMQAVFTVINVIGLRNSLKALKLTSVST